MDKNEQAVLSFFVDEMEQKGLKHTLIYIDFDEQNIGQINAKYATNITFVELKEIIMKLLAHEYIKHAYLGADTYSGLQITTKGVGVVTSLRAKKEALKNRSFLKKVSDAIENHKGLATFIGILISATIGVLALVFRK